MTRSPNFIPAVLVISILAGSSGWIRAQDKSPEFDDFRPVPETVENLRPLLFSIPAPRGQILDRRGRPLARTAVAQVLTLSLPSEEDETAELFTARVKRELADLPESLGDILVNFGDEELEDYFAHRRRIPLAISQPIDPVNDLELIKSATAAGLTTREIYIREYPHGKIAAHVLGHLGQTGAPLRGPVRQEEPFWQPSTGKAGIEATFDSRLAGRDGLMLIGYDDQARRTGLDIIEPAVPGSNVVLSIDIDVQRAVEDALEEEGRPGAAVVIDTASGNILAMASFPTFDPNAFVPAISTSEYQKLASDPNKPQFNRAVSAAYPPGSVFKPVVALAALETHAVSAAEYLNCGPSLKIDGRDFHNWSDKDDGRFNVRGALVRSCNTYFYQAAIRTGDAPILAMARDFGFANAPNIPLPGVTAGALPDKAPSSQGRANLSIGQGEVLASAVQVASMMSGFLNKTFRPNPRLVMQVQSQDDTIVESFPVTSAAIFNYHDHNFRYVQSGLYGVVNHERGTAKPARMEYVPVSGKTGTAQWSKGGEMSSAVWFTGFVDTSSPPISFSVVLEGKPGEKIYGGSTASPVASSFLRKTFAPDSTCGIARARRTSPYPIHRYEVVLPKMPTRPVFPFPSRYPTTTTHTR